MDHTDAYRLLGAAKALIDVAMRETKNEGLKKEMIGWKISVARWEQHIDREIEKGFQDAAKSLEAIPGKPH